MASPGAPSPLAAVAAWPAGTAAVGVTSPAATLAGTGPLHATLPLASVTKVITALAVLVAVEEETVSLDDPAGPDGSTVAHLLAHASGLGFDTSRPGGGGPGGGLPAGPPGRRRIYSNTGFEVLADVVAGKAGMPFADYASEAVLGPLGMAGTRMTGSAGSGAQGTAADLLLLGRELLNPTIVSRALLRRATTVAFPGLDGVLPGFGHQAPNDWGLGFELRDHKSPHWTGAGNSPATFGHFGRSGTFLWVDPAASLACAGVTDRDFGPWAAESWPALSDAVLDAFASH